MKTRNLVIRVSENMYDSLEKIAKRKGMTISELVRYAIQKLIDEEDVKMVGLDEIYRYFLDWFNTDNVLMTVTYCENREDTKKLIAEASKYFEEEDVNIEVRWQGAGYYDVWGIAGGLETTVIDRIENIIEGETEKWTLEKLQKLLFGRVKKIDDVETAIEELKEIINEYDFITAFKVYPIEDKILLAVGIQGEWDANKWLVYLNGEWQEIDELPIEIRYDRSKIYIDWGFRKEVFERKEPLIITKEENQQ